MIHYGVYNKQYVPTEYQNATEYDGSMNTVRK